MDDGIEQNPAYGTAQPFGFHGLRHTAATLAFVRQGVPLHTVSRMPGHSDPAMTLRRYAHVLEDMEDEGGRAMDELF
jgi:integrase